MNTLRHKTVACIVSALVANAVFGASSIEPPKISVVDRRQVNMVNGQVVHTLPTVAIGGAMGLLHSVSIDANEFKYQGYQGFRDKFYGQARNAELSTDPYFSPRNVLRVYDFADTVDFLYCAGAGACVYGQALQQYGAALATGYWYQSMGDERHTLVVDPGNSSILIWTKPDGTQV